MGVEGGVTCHWCDGVRVWRGVTCHWCECEGVGVEGGSPVTGVGVWVWRGGHLSLV